MTPSPGWKPVARGVFVVCAAGAFLGPLSALSSAHADILTPTSPTGGPVQTLVDTVTGIVSPKPDPTPTPTPSSGGNPAPKPAPASHPAAQPVTQHAVAAPTQRVAPIVVPVTPTTVRVNSALHHVAVKHAHMAITGAEPTGSTTTATIESPALPAQPAANVQALTARHASGITGLLNRSGWAILVLLGGVLVLIVEQFAPRRVRVA